MGIASKFLIVQNITNDVILGTLFLTQIYSFSVNESGVHIKILNKQISFNFLSATKQGEVSLLQNSSIFKQVNQLLTLMDESSYEKIFDQLLFGYLYFMTESFPYLRHLCDPLYRRLRTVPTPWSDIHTHIVGQVNRKVRSFPCLGTPYLAEFIVTATDASDIGLLK